MAKTDSSPFDDTRTAIAEGPPASGTGTPAAQPAVPVGVVEGSGCPLSAEMQSVLRRRLRIAALVLFGGFAVFLFYDMITSDWSVPAERRLLLAKAIVTVLLGMCGGILCRRCPMKTNTLRRDELIVFGAPAIYFVLTQWYWAGKCAAEHQFMPSLAEPWLMLIFTYALFIPNNWQRAAVVAGMMAAAPLMLIVALWIFHADCAGFLREHPDRLIDQALVLTLAAVSAAVGTHTIGTLRREAIEAKQMGQYRLKRRLGAGGMGEVHLAEHQLMKRPCAIKLIHPERAGDPRMLARFEREVRAMAKLSHWNTVEIFDYGRAENGDFYYVMEYLPGLSLSQLVRQHGPLPAERVIYLLRQVCDALREAHAAGLIHRDIKPGNIFAAQRGGVYDVAKLLDFGLVKPISDLDTLQITQEGTITGSPLYMSPEQATGDGNADERGDIYALGAVAYYLLTSHPPFEDDKPLKVILAHATMDVALPSQLRGGIPQDLEEVVMRCLEKSPEDRFQTADQLDTALAACEAAEGWTREDARRWWVANGSDPSDNEELTRAAALTGQAT